METPGMKKTANTWAELIASASSKQLDDIPDGFLTCQQIAKQEDKDVKYIQKKLKVLIEEGKVEFKKFRIKQFDGVVFPTMHYKIISK
jgi:hypothetical protein